MIMLTLSYLEFYSGIGGWGYALEHACHVIHQAAAAKMLDQTNHQQKKLKLTYNDNDKATQQPFRISAKLLAAYDHSDLCNSVFLHNHTSHDQSTSKSHKPRQTPIEKITKNELEAYCATIWCMSPPCQPHTRQHSNQHKEMDDPRSKSFLHLCHMLSVMDESKLPCLLLLENVVGFENAEESTNASQTSTNISDASFRGSFAEWRRVLSQRQYEIAHFHLDPTHVGLPNNRPRYYCIAFRVGTWNRRLMQEGSNAFQPFISTKNVLEKIFSQENLNEKPHIHDETSITEIGDLWGGGMNNNVSAIPEIQQFLDADLMVPMVTSNPDFTAKQPSLKIPLKVQTSSSAWCFDIITPLHTCSSCFTHSYGKYIRGTGSILYTGPLRSDNEDGANKDIDVNLPSIQKFQLASPEDRSYDENWSNGLNWDHIRYLSGTEIARLMGFPVLEPAVCYEKPCTEDLHPDLRQFSFPSSCTMKQQWKLLGNSLNVKVAAKMAEIGIHAILNDISR